MQSSTLALDQSRLATGIRRIRRGDGGRRSDASRRRRQRIAPAGAGDHGVGRQLGARALADRAQHRAPGSRSLARRSQPQLAGVDPSGAASRRDRGLDLRRRDRLPPRDPTSTPSRCATATLRRSRSPTSRCPSCSTRSAARRSRTSPRRSCCRPARAGGWLRCREWPAACCTPCPYHSCCCSRTPSSPLRSPVPRSSSRSGRSAPVSSDSVRRLPGSNRRSRFLPGDASAVVEGAWRFVLRPCLIPFSRHGPSCSLGGVTRGDKLSDLHRWCMSMKVVDSEHTCDSERCHAVSVSPVRAARCLPGRRRDRIFRDPARGGRRRQGVRTPPLPPPGRATPRSHRTSPGTGQGSRAHC